MWNSTGSFPRADISSQKRMKNPGHGCENGSGAGGEIDRTSGGIDAVELDGPERARLSE
jgi:hypothetical protein